MSFSLDTSQVDFWTATLNSSKERWPDFPKSFAFEIYNTTNNYVVIVIGCERNGKDKRMAKIKEIEKELIGRSISSKFISPKNICGNKSSLLNNNN